MSEVRRDAGTEKWQVWQVLGLQRIPGMQIYEMNCFIRKATNNDISALRELYLALEEDGVRYQPEHFVIGERTEEFFHSIFHSDNQDILVEDIKGKAIGFVHVMILQQKKV